MSTVFRCIVLCTGLSLAACYPLETSADGASSPLPGEPLFHASFDRSLSADQAAGKRSPVEVDEYPELVPGKSGQGVRLAGHRQLGYELADNLKPKFGTVAFWAKPEARIDRRDNFDQLFHTSARHGDKRNSMLITLCKGRPCLYMSLFSDGLKQSPHSIDYDWPTGEWRHFALTWQHGGDLTLYVNGKLTLQQRNIQPMAKAPRTFWIGCMDTPNASFKGVIDEFYVFPEPLSREKILDVAAISPLAGDDTESRGQQLAGDRLRLYDNLIANGDFSYPLYIAWEHLSRSEEQKTPRIVDGVARFDCPAGTYGSLSQFVSIPAAARLSLSFDAKGAAPLPGGRITASLRFAIVRGDQLKHSAHTITADDLSDSWQTWSETFAVPSGKLKNASLRVKFDPPEGKAGIISLDNFVLRPQMTPSQLSALPEAAMAEIENAALASVYSPDERPGFVVRAVNCRQAPGRFHLRATVLDFHGEETAATSKEFHLPSRGTQRVSFNFKPHPRRGFYAVHFALLNSDNNVLDHVTRSFCVFPERPKGENDPFFGLSAYRTSHWMAPVYARLGIGAVLAHVAWLNQAGPDDVRFSGVDLAVSQYKQAGLDIYGFFHAEGTSHSWMIPGWERENIRERREAGRPPYGEPHFSALKRFADAAIQRYRDDIDLWHIKNEIDGRMTSEADEPPARYYINFIKTISRAAREHDPGSKVTALSVTSRDAKNDYRCLRALWPELEADVDQSWPHPYPSPRLIGPGSQWQIVDTYLRERLRKASAIGAEFGHPKIGTSELGYGVAWSHGIDSKWQRVYAQLTARMLILARSIPRMTYLGYFTGIESPDVDGFSYGMWAKDLKGFAHNLTPTRIYPRPVVAAYAAAADLLAGVTNQQFMDREKSIYACAFRQQPGWVLAVWSTLPEPVNWHIDLPAAATVHDVMGNPVEELSSGETMLKLTDSPVYLRCEQGAYAELLAAARDAYSEQPELKFFSQLVDGGRIELYLANQVSTKLQADVSLNTKQVARTAVPPLKTARVTVDPGDKRTAALAVAAGGRSYNHRVEIDPLYVPQSETPLGLEDSVAKFKAFPPIFRFDQSRLYPPDAPSWGYWKDLSDLSGTAWMVWDEEHLHVVCDVTDDVHIQDQTGRSIWSRDTMIVAIDANNDAAPYEVSNTTGYGAYDYELCFTLNTEEGKQGYCYYAAEGTPLAEHQAFPDFTVSRRGNITRYRVAIPWHQIPPLEPHTGRVFKANVVITDADELRRFQAWMGITYGIHTSKDPSLYRSFMLSTGALRAAAAPEDDHGNQE